MRTVSPPLENRRVFLVDDESVALMIVEDMLKELGAASVQTAMTLEEAQTVADTADFDLAVLDIDLSGRPSYPVAAKLRARSIPFLFATGYKSEKHNTEWISAITIVKPFEAQDLARALEELLSKSRGS